MRSTASSNGVVERQELLDRERRLREAGSPRVLVRPRQVAVARQRETVALGCALRIEPVTSIAVRLLPITATTSRRPRAVERAGHPGIETTRGSSISGSR